MELSTRVSEPASPPLNNPVRPLYFALRDEDHVMALRSTAQQFLRDELAEARQQAVEIELPDDPAALQQAVAARAARVGEQYRSYLAERRAGAPRRYFRSRAHALYFLRNVAPTKLVDGAWLSGLLGQWQDLRLTQLITIYLEELGDGVSAQNHVAIYRRLLASEGCDQWEELPDVRYRQGTVQLAFGLLAEQFLPELIGYNLSYEQPPLHLLITAYELAELGVDPYYFTLHATIDNAAGGHASRAVASVLATRPRRAERQAFFERVRDGYRLSETTPGSLDAIDSFDAQQEVERILRAKSRIGQSAHADRCRLEGRSINEWLTQPDRIPALLQMLEARGWIRRNREPAESRFWRLLQGDDARMFGVFDRYELSVIADWIRNDYSGSATASRSTSAALPGSEHRPWTAANQSRRTDCLAVNDFNHDQQQLSSRLAAAPTPSAAMALLIPHMSPAHHHTPLGLFATRCYVQLFRTGSLTPDRRGTSDRSDNHHLLQ